MVFLFFFLMNNIYEINASLGRLTSAAVWFFGGAERHFSQRLPRARRGPGWQWGVRPRGRVSALRPGADPWMVDLGFVWISARRLCVRVRAGVGVGVKGVGVAPAGRSRLRQVGVPGASGKSRGRGRPAPPATRAPSIRLCRRAGPGRRP